MKIRTNIISIGLILLALFIAAIYLIGEKISDVGNDMNNANAREACRYRAESVAYEFKKTEELQRLAREFLGKVNLTGAGFIFAFEDDATIGPEIK